MHRRIQLILAGVLLLGPAGSASAQDARKIVEQYVKAAGGSKALSGIRALALEGTVGTTEQTNAGSFTLETKSPNRYYLELIAGPKRLLEAYNGKSAWGESEAGHPRTLLGSEAAELEATAQIANTRLVDLKRNKLAVSYVGAATVLGKAAEQIEVVTASGVKRQMFFDSRSHLIVQESSVVAGQKNEVFYGDYRAVSGIQISHSIELRRGADSFRIEIRSAAVNGPVSERVFDFPRKSQAQLPDLKALFEEIDKNQKAIDKIQENYAGTRTEEETEYESDDKVKKHELMEYTFFYLEGHEISTLVKKDGKPLSEAEQKKENERAQKRVQEVQAEAAKKKAKEEKGKEEGKTEKDDDVGIEIFLRACQFVNPRRERFRGQDVLVFDFEGNPDFKPHKLADKIVQKLAGVVWIDEKTHDVARLEAYFASDAKIAGGMLVNLQRGSGFVFEQAFLNNEVWLPTYEEAHLGVRVLLVKGIRVTAVTRYSDYKRFHVESLSQIAPPKPQ
ncbi:MAG TPA: hypothetical protein VJW51_10040 [Candidatus Acidoferrales bacterium]|nr:hypothetical protein [Candidatus Acidoferrales bacterium]